MSQFENVFWLFRCTEYKHAETLINEGCIKLNTPKVWIECEKIDGKGRGDLLEGIYAFTKVHDIQNVLSFRKKRENVVAETINGNVYFRNENVLSMPCLCLFGLTDTMFKNSYFPETDSWATTTSVGKNYFEDFYKHETRESIMSLPDNERPVLVVIQSPNKFFNKIYEYFESIGLGKDEVIIKKVDYIDKSLPFVIRDAYPQEVFVKDHSFNHQSEIRIAINTQNNDALRKLEDLNYIIKIGSLKDFAIIHEYYLEDMFIQLRNSTLRYVLPVPETFNFDDLERDEVLQIIRNIENAEYEENYEKEGIEEQFHMLVGYFENRFNEKITVRAEFYEKLKKK